MPDKVLFISHDATRTGAPIIFLHFLKWFRKNTDIPFQIILKDGGPLEAEFHELGPTHGLNWNNAYFDQTEKEKYLFNLAKQDFSLIYSNTVTNGQVLACLAEADCPILTHVHELEYRIRHQTDPEIIAATTAFTDHYIAVSRAVKQNLVLNHDIPEKAVSIVRGFVPTEDAIAGSGGCPDIRNSLGIPPGALIVGACGTSDWRKGPDLFIQLAAAVRRKLGSSVHFCWVGAQVDSPEFSALEHDAGMADLDDCMHFIGPQKNPEDYFSLFDVFVSVSREDPFPLVNLEAAALGIPVVCFDNSGGGREFVGNACGFVVDYLDIAGMSARVMDLLKDTELRTRLGNQARKKAREYHDISSVAPEILRVMQAVGSDWNQTLYRARQQKAVLFGNTGNRLQALFSLLSDPGLTDTMHSSFLQQLARELQNKGFFQDVYNLASWLDLKGEGAGAQPLFTLISRYAADADRELAGKALYKKGCFAAEEAEAVEHFRSCLELYPGHGAARERLHDLTKTG
ncbi:MAG: glycosyltransferase family 4 protein [Acidobacteria bacterium]|nr:glycosyltransferase family 4 protein [Acidobacteriota bacterium]